MFRLIDCGYAFAHHSGLEINRPAGTSHYVFVIYRSPCEFKTDEGFMSCQNHCALFEPKFPHHYRSTLSPFVNDWIHFEILSDKQVRTSGNDIINSLEIILNKPIPVSEPELLQRIIKSLQINKLLPDGQSTDFKQHINSALITTLLSLLSDQQPTTEQDNVKHKYYRTFNKIRNELYRMPAPGIKAADLAAQAGLSVSRFQHLYREIFKCTISDDVDEGRLQRARYLLENSDLVISAIAEDSGYTNETHMIRHFNKYLNTTPGKYRREHNS